MFCLLQLQQHVVEEGGQDVGVAGVAPHGEVAEAEGQRCACGCSVLCSVAVDVAAEGGDRGLGCCC